MMIWSIRYVFGAFMETPLDICNAVKKYQYRPIRVMVPGHSRLLSSRIDFKS